MTVRAPVEEGDWEPSGPGTVLLDIDDTVGAVVLLVPADRLGEEIEAVPFERGSEGKLVHTAVRERILPGGTVHAAFFPTLAPGDYRLRPAGGGDAAAPIADVRVVGGAVRELDVSAGV